MSIDSIFFFLVQWAIEMTNYEWADVWCGVVQEVQRVLWTDTGRAGRSGHLEVD